MPDLLGRPIPMAAANRQCQHRAASPETTDWCLDPPPPQILQFEILQSEMPAKEDMVDQTGVEPVGEPPGDAVCLTTGAMDSWIREGDRTERRGASGPHERRAWRGGPARGVSPG